MNLVIDMILKILVAVSSYLLGAVPFGYLIYIIKTGEDIRNYGSGNIGATNVQRTLGTGMGIATLVLDVFKGALPVLSAIFSGFSPFWIVLCGALAILGHMYPVYLKFRGGKGVATWCGVFLIISPFPFITAIIVFFIVVTLTRIVSLGSLAATGALPLIMWLFSYLPSGGVPLVYSTTLKGEQGLIYGILLSAFCACMIWWRHRGNISRLLKGEENKLGEDR